MDIWFEWLPLTEHRDTNRVKQDANPREPLDAVVGLSVALDGEVCTKEALPVAEVLARKDAEGRRAHHGKDNEKEHQQPRQGRTNHLLWTSTGRERAGKKRAREESEQDSRRQDNRGLCFQKPSCT